MWMQTYTGLQFYPLAPQPADVAIEDIAHALSLICRYGGHVDRFYSVAEHCVLVSQAVPPEHALHALLHDATEAYVGDMVRPLKHQPQMSAYVDAEDRVWEAVCERFQIDPVMPPSVKDADNRILLTERDELMRHHGAQHEWEQDGLEPLSVLVTGWAPPRAEREYLARFHELSGGA